MSDSTVIGWRVWYADGSVLSSADCTWAALPKDGVLGVRVYEEGTLPNGRAMGIEYVGLDYYWRALSDRGIPYIGCSNDTLADIHRRYPGACVLRGKWTDNEFFAAVHEEIKAAHVPPPEGPGA